MREKLENWLDILNFWFEHIEDYGDRYPDMKPMVKNFERVIDELYTLIKTTKGDKNGI